MVRLAKFPGMNEPRKNSCTPLKLDSIRAVERAYGIIKHKSGDKSFAEEWAEHKREERELEEAKFR